MMGPWGGGRLQKERLKRALEEAGGGGEMEEHPEEEIVRVGLEKDSYEDRSR